MITLIIKSYFIILLTIGLISIFLFIMGLCLIVKNTKQSKPSTAKSPEENLATQQNNNPSDTTNYYLLEIAGDDLIATQLDLARAYIETGKNALAKTILDPIIAQGNAEQQQEAQRLKSYL